MVVDLAGLVVVRESRDIRFRLEVPAFEVRPGERLALVGPSGCGKSTLLDCLALLLRPSRLERFFLSRRDGRPADAGNVLLTGRADDCARFRAGHVGYVPQIGGLLPALTVERNITLARDIGGGYGDPTGLMAHLGLLPHRGKKPASLSVGERQRVAIGRALVAGPALVLADEPTSALDPVSADRVLSLLVREAESRGAAVVIATHDAGRAARHGFTVVERALRDEAGTVCSTFARAA